MMTESFSCVLCDEKFPDRDCLREHFRSHGTKKETLPKVVPKVAPKQIASFTTCTPSRCEICDTPCSSINFYWQHYRTCHPYWRGVDCAHCGKHFLHNADYTRHSKDHEGLSEEQVFDCSMCDSTFFNKAAVEIHKAGHEHVTNLQNKAKDNQTSKTERVPNALKMKANYCKPCNCQFVNSSALAQHLVTHSLYICLVCGKEMSDDETFRNHQKVHLPTSSTKTSGTADSKSPKATSCSLRYSYEFVLVIVFCGLLVCKGQGSYDGAGCGFPGEPLEGSVTPNRSNYDTRDTVTYACLADYTLVGPHQITCRQDNTWSSDAPICLKEAAEFERSTVADGNVNTCGDVTNSRSLTLKTLPFSLHSISAVIFSFSKVSGTPIVSVHVSNRGENPQLCRTIANIPRLDSNVYHRYDCDKSLSGNTVTISTRSAAAFSPAVSVTICEIGITSDINGNGQSKCGRPPIPFHGRIKHMTEDRVIYECDKGFFVRPSATSNCEDRVWKNHVQCIRMNLTCGNPGCPANGYYENVDSVRETVSYACLPGHFLVGPSVRTCLSNGTWSNWNQMPKCVPNVAYDKYIVHSDGSEGKNKPSVDGNVETCDVIGYRRDDTKQQRWWRLEFKTLQRISSIQIVQPKGQQKRLKVSTLYSSASSMINIPCNQEPDQSLRCESRQPFNVVAIYVQPEEIRTNFTLCEVIVTDLIGTIPCGTIDEPLNGKVVYEREKPRIVCESGYKMIGTSDVTSCIGGQYRWSSPVRCIPMGPETTRPNVKPNYSTTYRPHHTKGTPESISTQEHAEVEKDTMLIGVIGIAVGVTAASISILISIVVIVCIMKRHYKKKHECSHANCSRQNSHHTHSYGGGSGGGGSRTGRDWDESSIHLYETVKPEYDTLEDPYAQTLVVNDSYILTTPKNTMNWTRPRLAPPRNNHIYDVVSTDDALARNDLLNGQTNQRVETIPRTSL